MQHEFSDAGLITATQLFDLRQLDKENFGAQIVPILPYFNFTAKFGNTNAGWLHLGPAGYVTDEVTTVNYKPYGHREGLLSTESYQLVRFCQDNGQPLTDPDSHYVRSSESLGTPCSPTGVYEGRRAIYGGGSMLPVFDEARAEKIVSLMRERIQSAHATHCPQEHRRLNETLKLEDMS